ncbi:hypothetical protein BpHYR1_053385 [Brachionus plicatilis]|uniref:Uncharacterized protein n=1 Tax=Brachionus plicatilis TaxID=10195 RepID=A0A3M7SKP4_BRAPC|nr:hypothetical protein BpHYR1_053385 [Brachionus plicatilis]
MFSFCLCVSHFYLTFEKRAYCTFEVKLLLPKCILFCQKKITINLITIDVDSDDESISNDLPLYDNHGDENSSLIFSPLFLLPTKKISRFNFLRYRILPIFTPPKLVVTLIDLHDSHLHRIVPFSFFLWILYLKSLNKPRVFWVFKNSIFRNILIPESYSILKEIEALGIFYIGKKIVGKYTVGKNEVGNFLLNPWRP